MSSRIDLPNRTRASSYLTLGNDVGLRTVWAATTHVIERARATSVRRELAAPFCMLDVDDLCVLGLWLVQVGPHAGVVTPPSMAGLGPAPHERLSRY
jgi:hypothetical protein